MRTDNESLACGCDGCCSPSQPCRPVFPYRKWHRHHSPSPAPVIEAEDLALRYPGAAETVVSGVSFALAQGECAGLIGPNGAGKSSLLKGLAGILKIEHGRFLVHGRTPELCRHSVAYLAQRSRVDWHFPITVHDAVLAGRYCHLGWVARPKAADHEIAKHSLDRVGLAHLAHGSVGTLSGGQLQRMLLARALAQEAELFLLDEPFNALDADSKIGLIEVIHSLKSEGRAFLIATHDCLGEHLCLDKIFSLGSGGVFSSGKVAS